MLLEQGWLAGARRVPHHITIAARMTRNTHSAGGAQY